MSVNLDKIENINHVHEVAEIMGIWEFSIEACPVKLKIKVKRTSNSSYPYYGVPNYRIQNSTQASPYLSMNSRETIQEALEDTLNGFLFYYKPNDPTMQYFLKEDW
ncbi:hypothetical protein HQ585_06175 [candidate division KSB1 bacterium]|nr:hypothetical protein [candidate division KSB1 bacterium]